MKVDTKLTATEATYANTTANSKSRRPESNGRGSNPRSGTKNRNTKLQLDFAYPNNAGNTDETHKHLVCQIVEAPTGTPQRKWAICCMRNQIHINNQYDM